MEKYTISKAPIVLGFVLIAVILGSIGLSALPKTEPASQVENQDQKTVVDTKTYTFENITLTYPGNWTVKDDVYTTPAGASGQVGATFIPANPKNEGDRIAIGGRQVLCEAFSSNQIKCQYIGKFARLPIYTGSSDPDVLAVFNNMIASAKVIEPVTITYKDEILGYTITAPTELISKNDAPLPYAPSSPAKATVFTVPAEMISGGTTKDANISIAKTKTACSLWVDGENKTEISGTKTVPTTVFEKRVYSDNGAGNFRTIHEYSTTKDKQCYRVALYIHTTNPGAEFQDQTSIESATDRNKEIEQELLKIFEQMVGSFAFTK